MKKSKVLITAIVGGAILLAGCTNNLSPASVSKNLTHNLNVLSSTVKNLDTINNSYLSNPDIYPISNNTIKASNMALSNIVPVRTETRKIATLSLDNESTNLDNINKENTELTNNNTTNNFYYDVKPIKYNPRYLQDISALENGDYLSNYISKVKTLYAITSDVIEANDALSDCKNYVLNYVVEIKDLNKEIENGTFEPSNQQISALNNYIGDIVEERGYEFLNMNAYYEEIGLDFSADFSDYGGHVNAVGAQKCTAFLSRYIVDRYGIEDRRGEEGRESWDESWDASYRQWQEELEEAKQTIAKRIAEEDFADAPVEEPE